MSRILFDLEPQVELHAKATLVLGGSEDAFGAQDR